ncbi:hypothetical protein KAX75_05145 [candidate division WOR-3 bacterium]|nr:hypothetical protein [candidate division WOR-3 bacterium]
MSNKAKVVTLWVIFLFGMTFHSLLAIMPLFWGGSIAMSPEQIAKNPMAPSMWMVLLFFLIPMIIIVLTSFIETKWYRITNFVFTLLFTMMNIWHLIGHFGETSVDPRQIVLLTFVLIFGFFLNIVSFKWIKEQEVNYDRH